MLKITPVSLKIISAVILTLNQNKKSSILFQGEAR